LIVGWGHNVQAKLVFALLCLSPQRAYFVHRKVIMRAKLFEGEDKRAPTLCPRPIIKHSLGAIPPICSRSNESVSGRLVRLMCRLFCRRWGRAFCFWRRGCALVRFDAL